MSKKTATITIIFALLLIAGGLGYYYFFILEKDSATETGPVNLKNISDYFPFGKPQIKTTPAEQNSENKSGTTTITAENPQRTTPLEQNITQVLRKITNESVAGAEVFDKTIEIVTDSVKEKFDKTFIRYALRGTGHIAETTTDSSNETTVSDTTIPKVYEALWPDQNTVVLRYLDDKDSVVTYVASIKQSTSTQSSVIKLDGTFLPENISSISTSLKGDRVLYVLPGEKTSVVISPLWGQKAVSLYSSPLRQWSVGWGTESLASLTTNASGLVSGFSYLLNTKSGGLTKILGDILGLTVSVNPTASYALYSESKDNSLVLHVFDIQKSKPTSLLLGGLPEKCVWSKKNPTLSYCAVPQIIPSAVYPDAWYKGLVSFEDTLWKVNTQTGITTKIFDLTREGKASIDAINLSLNQKEDVLIFTNKKDSTLWSLDLKKI